jgi:hypothetical protein
MSSSEYKSWIENDEFGYSSESKSLFQDIYKKFKDEYDLIFLVLNEEEVPSGLPYGRLVDISNNVSGIGIPQYDYSADFGSEGKLTAIMQLSTLNSLTRGPALHEIMHNWANYAFETTNQSHWGFTGGSNPGQLGGFDQSTLVSNGDNSYAVEAFGEFANGGNSQPYTEFELYLMGMIPLSSVNTFNSFTGISSEAYDEGSNTITFNASSQKQYSQSIIESLLGNRIPSSADSQKEFKLLVLVVTPTDLSEDQWLMVDNSALEFGKKGPGEPAIEYIGQDGRNYTYKTYNFWEATKGIGLLTIRDFN